jgi:hypothetical protein
MRAHLEELDLESFLEMDADENDEKQMKAAKRCQARLKLAVEGPLLALISKCTTPREVWKALQDDYTGTLTTRRPALMGELRDLRQRQGESVEAYSDRAAELLGKLNDLDIEAAEFLLCDNFIAGLRSGLRATVVPSLVGKSDQGFYAVVTELKNLVRLLPENVVKGKHESGNVLTHEGRGGKRKEGKNIDTRKCFHCGKVGHLRANCWELKKKGLGVKEGGHVLMMTHRGDVSSYKCDVETGDALIAAHASTDAMLLDSGTSHHIVNDLACISECKASDVTQIVDGGGYAHEVVCSGTVILDGGPSGPVFVTDVLLVPTIQRNLLSVSKLTLKGASVKLSEAGVRIISGSNQVLLTGHMHRGLYEMQCSLRCMQKVATTFLTMDLLHQRLGHPGKVRTEQVAKLLGVIGPSSDACETCIKAKFSQLPFERSKSKADAPQALLHSDVIGPYQIPSLGGARYVVTVLDDYSGFAAVHCIARKSAVGQVVKDTLVQWERQTGHTVKVLRTDNGTEYKDSLQKWMAGQGIVHQVSADYTPQQNGRAERLNRTLMEKARALLLQHNMPHEFWACAVDTACHLKNCTAGEREPVSAYQMFHNKKPDLSMLRVFGCLAYVRVPEKKRQKLDARAEPGVFTGYEQSSKSWRIYVYRDGWVCCKSRNVRFIEDKRPDVVLEKVPKNEKASDVLSDPLWLGDAENDHPQGVALAENVAENVEDDVSDDEAGDDASGEHDGAHSEASIPEEEIGTGNEPREAGYNASEDDDTSVNDGGNVQDNDRSTRNRKPSVRFQDHYVYHAREGMIDQPSSVQEALKRPDAVLWQDAINAELAALVEKNTYTETSLPRGKTTIPSKFVLNIKRDAVGKIDKYKARLVALGCKQIAGQDFSEVFAPTVQQSTVRVLIAIAAATGLHVHQIDVKTAFLNGDIEEEVYIKPPPTVRRGDEVWKLNKALYGLKQAARQWHMKLREELQSSGYVGSAVDPCLFMKGSVKSRVYILVHVDDALLVGEAHAVEMAKHDIAKSFDIKDLGPAEFFLGKDIVQTDHGIWVGQMRYASDVVAK